MAPNKEHPIKILKSVMERRDECLHKLNGGSKKTHVK
jgi:hypothetical protein